MNTSLYRIGGIHHITAIASSAIENVGFYTDVLGLRLVKKTVNFDDPTTYHLYYGDETGTPGTIMTFFPWEGMPEGRIGAGMIAATAFAIPEQSVEFWVQRLTAHGLRVRLQTRFQEPVALFSDPHGLPLELVGTSPAERIRPWTGGPVPGRHAIRGFHSATALFRNAKNSRRLLESVLGFRPEKTEGNRTRFSMADPHAAGIFFDVVEDPKAKIGQAGGGTVHHIAFRAKDDPDQRLWRRQIEHSGMEVTSVIDRKYFKSIYFREAGGILFEIATDPPGFAIDEPVDSLGRRLMLPAQYEEVRDRIEKILPRLQEDSDSDYPHIYLRPAGPDSGRTIVSLHGTGGDERDLIGPARSIGGSGSAVLSPRGNVRENGLNRFFRRFSEGIFDQSDVRRRAMELADFIQGAARRYGRDTGDLTAIGFSNGANIAAAILFMRPDTFSQAILVRPMMPLEEYALPDLGGKRVLIIRGRFDDTIPAESTDRLIRALGKAGADLTVEEVDSDHRFSEQDIKIAQQWVSLCDEKACAMAG